MSTNRFKAQSYTTNSSKQVYECQWFYCHIGKEELPSRVDKRPNYFVFTGKLLNMMDISYYLHRLVFVSACIWHIAKLRIIREITRRSGSLFCEAESRGGGTVGYSKNSWMLLGYMKGWGI